MKINSILKTHSDSQFNMTAMIDVVFLLIIFFMLICQFIVQENFTLAIPDDCVNAVVPDNQDQNAVTVSVIPTENNEDVFYAVRSSQFLPKNYDSQTLLLEDMSNEISVQTSRKENQLVHLRADKDLTYKQVQLALQALSAGGIQKVQLAAFKNDQE